MDLDAALRQLAGTPRLLIASDYDGVLAPIVTDPARAVPQPGAVAVLRALAALPQTAVAALSGRAREDLAAVSGLPPDEVRLVGSHGAELAGEIHLSPAQRQCYERLAAAVRELVAGRPGVRLETKPASVVVHTRTAAREVAAEVSTEVLAGPASWPEVHTTPGKEVIEMAVLTADKGTALRALREQAGAEAVLFLGDDVTDERAFAVLGADDVGVKVGPGATAARFRVPDPAGAVGALERLLAYRTASPAQPPAPI